MHAPVSYFKKCGCYSVLNRGKSKSKVEKNRGVKRTTGHYLPLKIILENNGVLNKSVVGAPFVNILQTMYLANGSQNFSRKTGKYSWIRANAFRKRSVVLTRVEKGYWWSLKVKLPKLRYCSKHLAWLCVGGVRWTTAWYDGLPVVRLTPTANFENIMEIILTHPVLRRITYCS